MQWLLDAGARVDAANEDGDTALHNAALRGRDGVIRVLAGKGANLELKNKKGQTPLALTAVARRRGVGNLASEGDASRKDTADLLRKLGAKE